MIFSDKNLQKGKKSPHDEHGNEEKEKKKKEKNLETLLDQNKK